MVKTNNTKDVTSLRLLLYNEPPKVMSEIKDLTEIENFTSLTHLEINGDHDVGSELATLDLRKSIALKELYFDYSYSGLVEALDLSKIIALEILSYRGSGLKKLYLIQNTLLTDLDCSGNDLKKLDLSQNTALTELRCNYNNTRDLNIRDHNYLTAL